jgi:hypothetical protein
LQAIEFDLPAVQGDSLIINRKATPTAIRVVGEIESHGDVTLTRKDGKLDEGLSARKFSIPELVDYLVAGSKLRVKYGREGIDKQEDVVFQPRADIFRIRGMYHILEAPQWIKIGGVVMQNASLNNLAECSRYKYITEIPYYDDFIFNPSVIVTYVEPSSEVGSLSAFAEGDIIVFVNGKTVQTVKDVHQVLSELPHGKQEVAVETDRGAMAICKLEDEE